MPLAIRFWISTAATTVAAPSASAIMMRSPPADQPAVTGGVATSTVARPPSATKPMIPMLNRPANPHCRFTPSAMIAEIRPILMISIAVLGPCTTPEPAISAATSRYSRTGRRELVIRIVL